MCFSSPEYKQPDPIRLPPPPERPLEPEKEQLNPETGTDRVTNRRNRGINAMRTDLSLPGQNGGMAGLQLPN